MRVIHDMEPYAGQPAQKCRRCGYEYPCSGGIHWPTGPLLQDGAFHATPAPGNLEHVAAPCGPIDSDA